MGKKVIISLVNLERLPDATPNWREKTLNLITGLIRSAADSQSHIIAFPENCNNSLEREFARFEPLDGDFLRGVAEVARRNDIYVILPLLTLELDRRYNSSILIDPEGTIAGIYHKNFPTLEELQAGVTPGETAPVFPTEYGRLGLCICFDLNFWEVGSALAGNQAELVVWSTMWPGGRMLTKWAVEFGFPIAAVCSQKSTLVDVAGRTIISIDSEVQRQAGCAPIVCGCVDMDRRLLHHDYNLDLLNRVYQKYGPTAAYSEWLSEECLIVFGSNLPDVPTETLMREFGLRSIQEYLKEVRENTKT